MRIQHYIVDKSGSICYKVATLTELGRAALPQIEQGGFLAPRSPRRGPPRPASGKPRRGKRIRTAAAPDNPPPAGVEDIAARAARLGITVERVLHEYAAIAFVDLRHIVEVEPGGGLRLRALSQMTEADVAAISEIVPGADPKHPRIKLYDRKAALDAIARHLGMFPAAARRREAEPPAAEEEEDPRDFLARELARLAAAAGKE